MSAASKSNRANSPRERNLGAQLPQHCQTSSLVSQHQMSLMAAGPQQTTIKVTPARLVSSSSSTSSSPSPTHTSNHQHHHQHHNNNHHLHQVTASHLGQRVSHKSGVRRVSSPGYHSAASSPGSSSIASPISSSASSTSSSGVSSAASSCARLGSPPQSGLTTNQQTIVSCTTASVSHGQPATSSISPSSNSAKVTQHHKREPAYDNQSGTPTASGNGGNGGGGGGGGSGGPSQQLQSNSSNQTNLLEHFPEIHGDGLKLSWAHGANNRLALDGALASAKLIVSGDISLAEMSRYPVPIMARPPLGVSDLTLETWLSDVIASRKGIKLTFTSTRTVEPAFRVLARHAQNLKGPLILSADILARPSPGVANVPRNSKQSQQQQQAQTHEQQPVDAWTFLMLCRTRFPRSIISIGWCPASGHAHLPSPDLSVRAADSSTPGPGSDPMFELDMMMMDHNQPQQQQQGAQQTMQTAQPQHHFNQPMLQLSSALPAGQQRLASLSVVQQLAAVAAAAAANNSHNQPHAHLQQHQSNRLGVPTNGDGSNGGQRHNFILSSNGSLNSSSGNSSGSPSPTSPLSHLMSPAHNAQQQQQLQQPSSQVVGWPAMAAAAMVAASNFRRRCRMDADVDEDEDEQADEDAEQEDDSLPLNLNINEADPQHATQRTLCDLAHKIQSLQQQQQSSSLNKTGQTSGVLVLASKLFSQADNSQQIQSANKWEHISKKAALANRLNSDSPSPVSTSPRQQQQHQISGNLLCVKPPLHLSGNFNQQHYHQPNHHHHQLHNHHLNQQQHNHNNHHHHHHSMANLALMAHGARPQQHTINATKRAPPSTISQCDQPRETSGGGGGQLGYTREMIDKMASLVKEYNLTQAITFPVEARQMLRNNSLAELQRLLYQVGANSTLTIVAQQDDLISVDELLVIRKHFTAQQLLFDLPDELAAALRRTTLDG